MPLYELHVNLDPLDIMNAITFCKDSKYEYIYLIAPELKIREHFIVTKWKEGTQQEAIARIKKLSDTFTKAGLKVLRLKVEEILRPDSVDFEYIEFHFKVPIDTIGKLSTLKELCTKFDAKLSYVLNKTHNPYVTIQMFDKDIVTALEIRANFIKALKTAGLPTTEKMHSEAVIMDTCPEMDM